MLLRGMAIAVSLIAGAALTLALTNGQAAVPAPEADASATLGMAPISIGNPSTAAALASLNAGRPRTTGGESGRGAGSEPEIGTYLKSFTVKAGDTVAQILSRAGAGAEDVAQAVRALKSVYNPRALKAGQKIDVAYVRATFGKGEAGKGAADKNKTSHPGTFAGFEIPLNYATRVSVAPAPEGGFKAQEIEIPLETRPARSEGAITDSLFAAGSAADVPNAIMTEMVRIFSWDVDFQRDIQRNDRFEVMFESVVDESGRIVHTGRVLYASLTLSGERKAMYLHKLADGSTNYFDEKGQSAKKALMRTPIDGARLSSSFGVRKHPILGYNKMHKGADFAAPPGTPIFAAGDGVIEMAGWNGAYGKYVRIRHNQEYSTAYAHMRAIQNGVTQGKRIRQGQVIGFVGTTGRSTGPHLHFEILHGGTQVNPMRVKMPAGEKLAGKELARFEAARDTLKSTWAALGKRNPQLAQK